ncbi:MAG: D-alanine--D-alanine ligase B [Alphaproteobacteria bacterium MarineAlpha10_Bin3]|nr:MAG: D-alanine--D-alanine ligase B [Alphaproteobacteria bacterium MarineAlpha10_Bin3]PPR70585.1 MAG: D-alanine--D-alanine ligase B [Alphaproteobacteria bacterium MarineAlpha4_Bin1]
MAKKVAVLMGGCSVEREVSLTSGAACAAALRDAGYAVICIDVSRDVRRLIDALTPLPDVVFNALHGRDGEDGKIQGLLDLLGVPYTHSGVLASAIAMNKQVAKTLFGARGIPCPEGRIMALERIGSESGFEPPYVMKPNDEGSSVGVHIVRPGDNRILPEEWRFGDSALVERYIPGRELTVVVIGDRAIGVTELRPNTGFYDYNAKYTDGQTLHLCPAPVPDRIAEQAMEYALTAHCALGCRGVSRADFRYDDTQGEPGQLYMLEVNTQPGMTPLSLVPEQAAQAGIPFGELVSWMVENAACDA